jgi:hypothetical protein
MEFDTEAFGTVVQVRGGGEMPSDPGSACLEVLHPTWGEQPRSSPYSTRGSQDVKAHGTRDDVKAPSLFAECCKC